MDDGAQHLFRRAHTTALTVGRGAVTCGHAAHERADDFVLSAPVSLGMAFVQEVGGSTAKTPEPLARVLLSRRVR